MLRLCKFDEVFLEWTRKWLNDPEIKALTNTPDFTIQDQQKWFAQLDDRNDYKIWGVFFNEIPIGACGIKSITTVDCEYWGYIGEKQFWGKGFGKIILDNMEIEARKLMLKSIWLQVIVANERAIKLYQKHGYTKDNEKQGVIFMRKTL